MCNLSLLNPFVFDYMICVALTEHGQCLLVPSMLCLWLN